MTRDKELEPGMNIRLNENAVDLPSGLTTWGEALDWLETDYLKAGQCITKVRFGDREASEYREDLLCDQELGAINEIDIESGDFDVVVQESLGELARELDRVTEIGSQIVKLFESRDQEAAYQGLSQYLESVAVLFSVFSEDLGGGFGEAGDTRSVLMASLEEALGQLISAQENGFWISVCDVLEYEITPVLDGWRELVTRTRGNVH